MGLLTRITGLFSAKSAPEGEYREGPYNLPVTGGWLSAEAGSYMNWWQMGHNVQGAPASSMADSCISAYAQTVAMCPGNQWKLKEDGGRSRQINSALTRVLKKPNDYQSISDFLLNLVHGPLSQGNAYALAIRNNRNEISELHLMDPRSSGAQLSVDGDVFYHLAGNPIVDRRFGTGLIVPARDVLHVRLHTPRHPLVGDTPIAAAALQMAVGNAALTQQIQFFLNQSRPSFVLATDQVLTKEQVTLIRELWNQQARGMNSGGTPILTAGLKAQPIGFNASDSQLVEMVKMSDQTIATAFRVPHPLVGLSTTPLGSTEALMQFWLASGLGFILNHVEEAIGNLFGLAGQPDEYLEFDTGALQRSEFKARIEALAAGVIGGIFSPDEARAEMELAKVPGGSGKEPRVQQQVVPLSAWDKVQPKTPAPPAAPPANDSGKAPAPPERGLADGSDHAALCSRALLALSEGFRSANAGTG